MKFKYIVVFLSILSLVILYGVSRISQPTPVSLSTLSDYEGQQVIVQGVVTTYRSTTVGSQLITLRSSDNKFATAILYIEEGEVFVEFGDTIQAIGKVQRYKDQWEVVIPHPELITIVQKWNNSFFPLWQLAEHPTRYLDTNINITGIITKKQQSTFVLSDPTETYTLVVPCSVSDISLLSNGDAVAVAGRFVYEPHTLRFLIQLSESNHRITKIRG